MVVSVATELANIGYLRFAEKASPGAPPDAAFGFAYFKADGLMYTMDDAGLETPATTAGAILLNPTTDVRNIIEPAADFIPLTVRGSVAAQTKSIFVAEEGSADTTVFSISGTGAVALQNFTDSSAAFKVTNKAGDYSPLTVRTDGLSDAVKVWTAQPVGSGNKTNHRGVTAEVDNESADVLTNAAAFYAYQGFNYGAGSITNAYGLYIEDVDSGGTTNHSIMTNAGFIVFNEGGAAEADIRIETDSEDHFVYIDSGANWMRIGDWDTNYVEIDNTGDLHFVGTAGLPFGHCYGNEIAWTQASAAQNTWYDVSDADMISGQLHNVTHDGNGQLTVLEPGMWAADWSGSFETNGTGVHVQVTFSVNGTEVLSALNHFETVGTNKQQSMSGTGILDLADNDTVNASIRTTDAGTPDLLIDHLMIRLVQVGGT